MMKENEIAALIEWGREEKQPDFLGFVNFCIENRASKNLIEVEMDGERQEFPLEVFWFDYKKPFPDFDFTIFYNKYNGMVSLPCPRYYWMRIITTLCLLEEEQFQVRAYWMLSILSHLKCMHG